MRTSTIVAGVAMLGGFFYLTRRKNKEMDDSFLGPPQILALSDLRPGDILLHRSLRQKPHQLMISRSTGSPYTHASIYLGDGMIAEATVLAGVRTVRLSTQLTGGFCIGVLRSQLGFGEQRSEKLNQFIGQLLQEGAKYDLSGAISQPRESKEYLKTQIDLINKKYGEYTGHGELLKDSFFCSALVVACYYVVGIIHETAQIAYPYKLISPADLHRDSTFGWFRGYLIPEHGKVPAGDPLRSITSWACIEALGETS